MRWVEKGKSSWSIGVILNVSYNTVNFHIKNAMRKLETSTRTQCVVKARRLRLIWTAVRGGANKAVNCWRNAYTAIREALILETWRASRWLPT
ncbi:response regulator transcription factor [Bradyrhizobium sp. CCBAU 45384]|uniref:response regulator transcription factor n=1 Tax=Bradyrhizobium sp. CCBAU 45384 TaxID=858428 RepID=UPI002305AE8A|nr:helix-turn-helix domain-containing protein [Bradyrhizobium sp. CCBAU 45384]